MEGVVLQVRETLECKEGKKDFMMGVCYRSSGGEEKEEKIFRQLEEVADSQAALLRGELNI